MVMVSDGDGDGESNGDGDNTELKAAAKETAVAVMVPAMATAPASKALSSLMSAKPMSTCPISAPAKVSCSIGDAAPMMPIPAETFMQSTSQSSQNCGVLCAFFKCT